MTDTLKHGIRRDAVDAMEREIDSADLDTDRRQAIEQELESARERQQVLKQQIDSLRGLLETSQKSIGLNDDHFRSAISCSLELIGAEPLKSLSADASSAGQARMSFPALDQREGSDASWADTMDALRAPRPRDQKLWEWRRSSPIRPVVFEDTGTMDDDVVHLHLEHRVVQRLLGRFIAQGFVLHDLSRACLTQTTDAIPRVVLLGRLCLYGPGAARLHEELIPVTARWVDPQLRKGVLTPYARDAETKTLSLLEDALLHGTGQAITETIAKQLQQSAPQDVQALLPHLTTRGQEYAKDAVKKQTERGEAEAKAMQEILEAQKKHIADTVAKHDKADPKQLRLDSRRLTNNPRGNCGRTCWPKLRTTFTLGC